MYSARKARVDTSGRLNVSDQGVVTRTILSELSTNCGGGSKNYLLDTSGYSSTRIVAHNFGPSQAAIEVSSAVDGQLSYPYVWEHIMPAATASPANHEISTPPAQTALRVTFCPAGFRILVFGSR